MKFKNNFMKFSNPVYMPCTRPLQMAISRRSRIKGRQGGIHRMVTHTNTHAHTHTHTDTHTQAHTHTADIPAQIATGGHGYPAALARRHPDAHIRTPRRTQTGTGRTTETQAQTSKCAHIAPLPLLFGHTTDTLPEYSFTARFRRFITLETPHPV